MTPDDLATLIYTSGTTGSPKAVMITHRNVRYGQQATVRVIPLEDQVVSEDGTATLVSYLPMAHVTGRTRGPLGPAWRTRSRWPTARTSYGSSRSPRRSSPTALIGIPRVWEKLHAALRGALPDVTPAAVERAARRGQAGRADQDRAGPVPDRDERRGADRPGDRRVLPRARRCR